MRTKKDATPIAKVQIELEMPESEEPAPYTPEEAVAQNEPLQKEPPLEKERSNPFGGIKPRDEKDFLKKRAAANEKKP